MRRDLHKVHRTTQVSCLLEGMKDKKGYSDISASPRHHFPGEPECDGSRTDRNQVSERPFSYIH